MKFNLFLLVILLVFAGLSCSEKSNRVESNAKVEQTKPEMKKDVLAGKIPGLKVQNIMTNQLKLVKDTEVVVSRVDIPVKTTLPKHWHPGEEFLYILKGSGVVWQQDKSDTQLNEGDVFKIPLKQIHTFKSGDSGTSILVFRVHEMGQPIRINVE